MNSFWLVYLEEVFDLGVVIGFLLNQRGAVQLTRAEPEHNKPSVSERMLGVLTGGSQRTDRT